MIMSLWVPTTIMGLDDDARDLEYQRLVADLFEVAGALRRDGEATARRAGQTQARWQVMWIAATGELTVPAIARRLGVTRQNVQRIAHELVADGLATFAENPDHRRSPLMLLTPRGREILDEINRVASRRNLQAAAELGDDGTRRLRDLLDDLRRALRAPPPT
jgi:DNA-binding MarR family transcriptional regulator